MADARGVHGPGLQGTFCKECGRDFLVAFSCQGRAVCPSCNARRMVETAAQLNDHVLPPFARDHVHQHDTAHLVYASAKPRPDGPRALVLTPLALRDSIAALVPPPRIHRHRY